MSESARATVDRDTADHDPSGAAAAERRPQWSTRVGRYGALGVLVLFVVIFSILTPSTFLTYDNLAAILSSNAVLMLLTLALITPLVAGQLDLSVGANIGLSSVVAAAASTQWGLPPAVAVVLGLLTGLTIGLANGLLVARVGLSSIIVTLASASVVAGFTLLITNGTVLYGVPPDITRWGQTAIAGIRLPAFYAAFVAIGLWFFLEQTPPGRYLYALGENADAAKLMGLPVGPLTLISFVIAGGIAGFAGIVEAAIIASGHPDVGPPLLLPAFAAAFLGATTIKPGYFNVAGSVVALLLIAIGVGGLQLLGAPFFVEPMFNGIALIVAVLVAKLASRLRLAA